MPRKNYPIEDNKAIQELDALFAIMIRVAKTEENVARFTKDYDDGYEHHKYENLIKELEYAQGTAHGDT